MAIITISRGCFSHGKEIAEKVAERLNYKCVGRELLIDTSKHFNVEEQKLLKSLHDAPSILERLKGGKQRYLDYIKASLLDLAKDDNLVYHGHAGHFLLPNLKNILKIRIIADLEERIRFLCQREGKSYDLAKALIIEDDLEREKWTRYLYGVDITDPKLYDMVLHVGKLNVEDITELICKVARSPSVKSSKEDLEILSDQALELKIKLALVEIGDVDIKVNRGIVHIRIPAIKLIKTTFSNREYQAQAIEQIKKDTVASIEQIVYQFKEVRDIIFDVGEPYYD